MRASEPLNGPLSRPGAELSPESTVLQIEERVRATLRRDLSARQALVPSRDDEIMVRGLIEAEVQAARREALLAGRPGLADPDGRLVQHIFDQILRLGWLSRILDDPRTEEIQVNSPEVVYVVKRGDDGVTRTERADARFRGDDEVHGVVRKVVAPLGRRLDESSPMVDARLPDGSRLHAIMPPLTSGHVVVTIRRFRLVAQTLEDLVRLGTLSDDAARFLAVAVQAGVNLLVSGGIGSGKSTTLNCLGATLTAPQYRLVTIEDTRELKLADVAANCIALEAREANAEGHGKVTIRDLVRQSLRMGTKRIIVGEVRGPEALDMLLAMCAGQPGMSTIHADSPKDALLRLKTYALLGGAEIPERAALELIAAGIHLVVHQALTPEGQRRVTSIYEVTGLEGATLVGNELCRWERERLAWTGIRPRCEARIRAAGLRLPW